MNRNGVVSPMLQQFPVYQKKDPSLVAMPAMAKHPLESSWTLWYFKNDKSVDWEDNLVQVNTFGTVEDFWATMNHIAMPSNLRLGCDYMLFKEGIVPKWEDPANQAGGRWIISADSQDRMSRARDTDKFWMDTLLGLIGNNFESIGDNLLNGVVINIRPKGNRIGLWIKTSNPQDVVLQIGREWKRLLQLHPAVKICFELHDDSKVKSSSTIKSTYRI